VLTNYTIEPNLNQKVVLFEARIELATSSVLDWRDNQLHHPNIDIDDSLCGSMDRAPDF
jgi:hypothetical protein